MGQKQVFSEDFSTPQSQSPFPDLPRLSERAGGLMPSSSSSSLRSLSAESSNSALIFTIPTTSDVQTEEAAATLRPISATADSPYQAVQALSHIRSFHLPNLESEESTMVRAFLAVLTTPSSSSSPTPMFHQQALPQQRNDYLPYGMNRQRASAFRRYFSSALGPTPPQMTKDSQNKQSMLKRAIMYHTRLKLSPREKTVGKLPTSSQMHHVLSERKRRQKLNESFGTLRSFLPQETKKDKASVLASAKEQLSTLRAQVAELGKKNQLLEAQLLPSSREVSGEYVCGFSSERQDVGITHVSESTSEENYYRIVDVRVRIRRECPMLDALIRLLEFIKRDRNVSLTSVEANSNIPEFAAFHYVNFRLKIEGDEWDESAFLEAVRRLIDDLAIELVN